jgi:hypothetical protein
MPELTDKLTDIVGEAEAKFIGGVITKGRVIGEWDSIDIDGAKHAFIFLRSGEHGAISLPHGGLVIYNCVTKVAVLMKLEALRSVGFK